MLFHLNILLCVWIIGLFLSVGSIPYVDPFVEKLDEIHDSEIYRAVITSMNDWQRRQEQKRVNNRLKREDAVSVCYPSLGCFDASGPFGYLDTLPSKPEEIGTKFLLYPGRSRRKSGSPPAEVPFEKLDEAFEWAKQGFNSSLPTKVLIHGFGSDCSYVWVYEIRSALMAVEEVNIICVDWSNGAALPNYVKASANTRLVGKQLSLLLRGLVEKNGLSLRNTHLIGFSLGAHIAGFTGADLGNMSRISGLDPAGPLFESQDPRARLDQTDATFVDVIHSNGENLILGGLGSSQPMGHVDFYPNGGRMQKGCSHLFVGAVSDIIWSSPVEGRSLCNHRRAYKFFIDSVSPRCHFPAFPCDSYEAFLGGKCFPCTEDRRCGNMGYYADRSKGRGQLFLITRDEEPFCAHQYHVKIETEPSSVPIKSYGKIQITLIGESHLNETFMMTKKEDEEMILGQSISRLLVPHPILAQLVRIEILYTAYTGWLSSGLTQWKMDKVTLMDSFGKISSVCKKNLILESGIPVLLPLYPGECNLPKGGFEEAEDRVQSIEDSLIVHNESDKKPSFIPTQVVRIGLDEKEKPNKNAVSTLNIPWRNDKENDVIDEAESSRALNTRIIRVNTVEGDGIVKEIVEPVLKPHSNKNARSHDPNKEKAEITEPILGPTTTKSVRPSRESVETEQKTKDNKLIENYKEADWVPKEIPVQEQSKNKNNDQTTKEGPLEQIATTVQFLPQRLARMFEQAEKYARETVLPFVSNFTPRFITDFISPKEPEPKYIPLNYEEPTTKIISVSSVAEKTIEARSVSSKNFNPPPQDVIVNEITTPYTHIQKIKKKSEPETESLQVAASEYTSTHRTIVTTSTTTTTTTKTRTTTTRKPTHKPKNEVNSRSRDNVHVQQRRSNDPIEAIIQTVQFIPDNIGKMIQQAERFTRTSILPLVSNLTPKFITDIFTPSRPTTRYIPFTSEEMEDSGIKLNGNGAARNKRNKNFNPPPKKKRSRKKKDNVVEKFTTQQNTTTYSHIQRIPKKGDTRKETLIEVQL